HRAILSHPPRTSGRNPEGGEAFSLITRLAASPPGGTRAIFVHAFAIGRLVGMKHTAASAVST
ncbi:MAG TPA: hypothetical protein VF876_16355, partial [Burkholderiales bacterium]